MHTSLTSKHDLRMIHMQQDNKLNGGFYSGTIDIHWTYSGGNLRASRIKNDEKNTMKMFPSSSRFTSFCLTYYLTGMEIVLNLPELMMFAFAVAVRLFLKQVFVFAKWKLMWVNASPVIDTTRTDSSLTINIYDEANRFVWGVFGAQEIRMIKVHCNNSGHCSCCSAAHGSQSLSMEAESCFLDSPVGLSFCYWFSEQNFVLSECEKSFFYFL